jgi:hypothetical protein
MSWRYRRCLSSGLHVDHYEGTGHLKLESGMIGSDQTELVDVTELIIGLVEVLSIL